MCDRETRKFNEEASKLSKNITILVISADLPWTQKRWCGAAGVDQVTTYSDSLKADFGKKYGCLIKEGRVLRRAVFVVDRKRVVRYAAYMPALGDEPNYEEVLAAARDALEVRYALCDFRRNVYPEGAAMTTILLKTNPEPENRSPVDRKRIVAETMSWQIRTHSHVWSPPPISSKLKQVLWSGWKLQECEIRIFLSPLKIIIW